MTTERHTQTTYSEVETWIYIALIIISTIYRGLYVMLRTIQIRKTILVCSECINQVLTAEEEIITITKEIALRHGSVQKITPVDVHIVVTSRELNSHHRLILIVECNLRHIAIIVVERILVALDNHITPLLHLSIIACKGIHLSQDSGSNILVESTYLALRLRQHVVS